MAHTLIDVAIDCPSASLRMVRSIRYSSTICKLAAGTSAPNVRSEATSVDLQLRDLLQSRELYISPKMYRGQA